MSRFFMVHCVHSFTTDDVYCV